MRLLTTARKSSSRTKLREKAPWITLLVILLMVPWAQALEEFYIVRAGDTFYRIAMDHFSESPCGRSRAVVLLMKMNPEIADPSKINVGQKIRLFIPLSEQSDHFEDDDSSQLQMICSQIETEIERSSLRLEEHKLGVSLVPYFGLLNLNSKDLNSGGEATLASKLFGGLEVAYKQKWDSIYRSYFVVRLEAVNFEQASNSQAVIENESIFFVGLGAGVEFQHGPDSIFHLSAEYRPRPFVRATAVYHLSVDSIQIPEVKFSYETAVYKRNDLGVLIGGKVTRVFGANGQVLKAADGDIFSAALSISQKNDFRYPGNAELEYSVRSQDTDYSQQVERLLMLRLEWVWGNSNSDRKTP